MLPVALWLYGAFSRYPIKSVSASAKIFLREMLKNMENGPDCAVTYFVSFCSGRFWDQKSTPSAIRLWPTRTLFVKKQCART